MNIRLAEKADIDALVGFNRAMALETEGKNLEADVLRPGVAAVFDDANKGFYVVADIDGTVTGGLLVTFEWSDWRNKWFWWIQSVYVREDFRRRGVFRLLYEHVAAQARARGDVVGLRLYVERENHRAQTTYDRLGMGPTGYLVLERCPL